MGPLAPVAIAVWSMLPAYVPNNVAVVAGGGRAIDGGRQWRGRRLLGDGKTWRGTIAGTAVGIALAVVLDVFRVPIATAIGVSLPDFPLPVAIGLAGGAMLGDIVASFVKRRLGRARGMAVPLLDQLDLVAGAFALTALLAPAWFVETFTPTVVAVVVILTPALHLGTNAIAYVLGFKAEPW